MRGDRYKTSAGLLTLAVHLLLIGVLYFGVKWQMQSPQGLQVDIWSDLPQTGAAPAAPPPPPPPAQPQKTRESRPQAEEVHSPPKPDIALAKKKKAEMDSKKKPVKTKKPSKAEEKRTQADMKTMEQLADLSDQQELKAQAAQSAQARAAIASEMEKYKALISSKIRNGIVRPPDVPDDAKAIFEITLLPDGSVMGDPRVIKPSGYPAYDEAIIRAILKARTLPLPKDATTRERFINPNRLKLEFRAGE